MSNLLQVGSCHQKIRIQNITLDNGGMKDWMKAGNEITAVAPLPAINVNFVDIDELQKLLAAADKQTAEMLTTNFC